MGNEKYPSSEGNDCTQTYPALARAAARSGSSSDTPIRSPHAASKRHLRWLE